MIGSSLSRRGRRATIPDGLSEERNVMDGVRSVIQGARGQKPLDPRDLDWTSVYRHLELEKVLRRLPDSVWIRSTNLGQKGGFVCIPVVRAKVAMRPSLLIDVFRELGVTVYAPDRVDAWASRNDASTCHGSYTAMMPLGGQKITDVSTGELRKAHLKKRGSTLVEHLLLELARFVTSLQLLDIGKVVVVGGSHCEGHVAPRIQWDNEKTFSIESAPDRSPRSTFVLSNCTCSVVRVD